MTFLGLSEPILRKVAEQLKVTNAATAALETVTASIQSAFQPGKFFGEVSRVDSKTPADSVLIFCHGLGGSGDRWVSFVADKIAPHMPSTRFVLPTAPTRPLSRNPPDPMTAWYDFTIVGKDRSPKLDDLLLSATYMRYLAQTERESLLETNKTCKVFFGGFSQGATLSIYNFLTNAFPFDGIVALSGYSPRFVPFDRDVLRQISEVRAVPIFIAHGDADDIIPLWMHTRSVAYLESTGIPVERIHAKVYPGLRHSTGPAECTDVVAFLQKCMKA